jgi:hypothetical protein
LKKNSPNFSLSSPNSLEAPKGPNIYNKAQFESPKHLHQTTWETYSKPCFETAFSGENVINLLKQKVAQNVTISLVAYLPKNHPIWSPCLQQRIEVKKVDLAQKLKY